MAKPRLPITAAMKAALPGWLLLLGGSLIWAGAMAASAWIGLTMRQWALPVHLDTVVLIFFAGGMLALVPGWWLARSVALWRGFSASQRFSAHFLAWTFLTVGITAFIHSQIFRAYFAEWHEPFGTKIWVLQTVFTSLAAIYHFLVMGLTLFLPLGLPALLLASLWAARKPD